MTPVEYQEYWIPACINLYDGDDCKLNWAPRREGYNTTEEVIKEVFATELQLDEDLGIDEAMSYFRNQIYPDKPMPEELKKLLMLLAGPNGKALLKVYRIQKGLVK